MEQVEDVVIVGAGVAGLATALGLHRNGVGSLVLESAPSLRNSGFAIGVWTNAWCALDALGIGNKVREQFPLVERFMLVSPSSGVTLGEANLQEIEGKIGKLEIRSVGREFLLETLAAELPNESIRYSSKVVSIEEDSGLVILHLADGSVIKAKVLIGADGINSAVAKYLGLKKPSFSGRLAARGLAQYTANHGYESKFIQINGRGIRAGMIPTTERSIYWYFTWSPSKYDTKKADESITTMREFIVNTLSNMKAPEEMIEVIRRSEMGEVFSSPLKYRSPLSLLFGNFAKKNICVIGDALHPMTPDLGQGGCIALEDSIVLARCLSQAVHQGKPEEGLKEFARIRRWRCAVVVGVAYIVGFVQESGNWFVSILREKVLGGIMAGALLKVPDYDCGKL